ncbi:MAG: HNH endonuclease signature motif containing protein [bacterium]|nr:HNH endonuclease signature motif containing protein [bacterium]
MTIIPATLRRATIERTNGCCEYCLLGFDDGFFSHEVDHVIAEKHHGHTTLDNLCLSCFDCNRHKGSDIASIDLETMTLTPLFHPRVHKWDEHFKLSGIVIQPLTPIGRVTVDLLQINDEGRLDHRQELLKLGRYPCKISENS